MTMETEMDTSRSEGSSKAGRVVLYGAMMAAAGAAAFYYVKKNNIDVKGLVEKYRDMYLKKWLGKIRLKEN